MVELLRVAEYTAQSRAQSQGGYDLHQGIHQYGDQINVAIAEGPGHAGGHSKYNQTHRVIQCHNGHQDIAERTLGLILVNDHHGRRRCCGCGDSTQDQAGRQGQLVTQHQVQSQQTQVNKKRCRQRLENGDYRGLFADLPQRRKPKFAANGESDKAQRRITDQAHLLHKSKGRKTQVGNSQSAQAQGPDQHTRHQIAGHVRQAEPLGHPGQKQARKHGNANR